MSVVPAGTMLGAIVGGILSDRLGRRVTLLWSGVIFIVGSILAPLSPNVGALIAARSLLGSPLGSRLLLRRSMYLSCRRHICAEH